MSRVSASWPQAWNTQPAQYQSVQQSQWPPMTLARPQAAAQGTAPVAAVETLPPGAFGSVSRTADQCSIPGAARTLSKFADAVYPDSSTKLPEGAVLEKSFDESSGLQGGIYRATVEGQEVRILSFRGTENDRGLWEAIKDWGTNALHGIGFAGFGRDPGALTRMPAQYRQAEAIARQLAATSDLPVMITGHSLGGGLGAYAAMQTGLPAIVFNAAGPQVPSYIRMAMAGLDSDSRGTELITQVSSGQDCLTNGIVGALAGRNWAAGSNVWEVNTLGLRGDSLGDDSGFCSNHKMDRLAKALDENRPLYHDEARPTRGGGQFGSLYKTPPMA